MQKRVIISVINDIATDQRVKRSAITLQEMGFEVVIVGRALKGSMPVHYPGMEIKRFKLLFTKGFLFYAVYNLRLFFYLLFKKADMLFSNDLDTLLPNYLASKIKGVPVVYDSHEYYTGVPELENRPLQRNFWKKIEQMVFPDLKWIMTVNESIARLYFNDYGIKPVVVRNVPLRNQDVIEDAQKIKERYSIPSDKKVFILQGSGINMHRGAEEAVEAMQHVEGAMLLIIGGGDVFDLLPALIKKYKVTEKVMLHGKIPADELKRVTSVCYAGLTLDRDTNINYRYSLPNKLFDYIQAGIPVIASDLVEVKNILLQYKVGVITAMDARSIADAMNKLVADEGMYEVMKSNTKFAADELCWENEKSTFVKLITSVPGNNLP